MVGIPRGDVGTGWYSWHLERMVHMDWFVRIEALAASSISTTVAPATTAGPDWWAALAGLHPLVLHFPIALVIVAAVIEFLALLGRRERLTSFSVTALLIGAPLTVLAAWSGWAMADMGYGRGWELALHRWLGVSSAILLVVLFVLTLVSCLGGRSWATASVRGLLLVAAILVGITAHFGGDMVWGESMFLKALFPEPETASESADVEAPSEPAAEVPASTEPAPPPESTEPAKPAATAAPDTEPVAPNPESQLDTGSSKVSFAREIQPILESQCWDCHGPTGRAKAGIRLASPADFQRVFDGHPMVAPGMPEKSLLLSVVSLPRDDEMAMPPDGPGLSDSEQDLIKRWIEQGARLDDPSTPAEPAPPVVPAESPAPQSSPGTTSQSTPDDPAVELDATQRSALEATSNELKERGVPVRPISQGSPFLVLNANGLSHRISPPFGDEDMASIKSLRPVLVEIDVSNTDVTDQGVAMLVGFEELKRVNLKDTAASDASAQVLAELPDLEVANFFGTGLGDQGLVRLAGSSSLERVYAGGSNVTAEGVAEAKMKRPGLTIIWKAPQPAPPNPE